MLSKKWLVNGGIFLGVVTATILSASWLYPVLNVSGESMTPSIKPHDSLLAQRWFDSPQTHDIFAIDQSRLGPSDVKHHGNTYLKRIVGTPGDALTFRLRDGQLLQINNQAIDYRPTTDHKSFSLKSSHKDSEGATFASHPYLFTTGDTQYPIYQASDESFDGDAKQKSFTDLVFNYPWLNKQRKHITAKTLETVTFTVPDDHYFALSDNRVVGVDSRHFGPVPANSLKYKLHP